MNRRNFIRNASIGTIGMLTVPTMHVFAAGKSENLTILHTNDLHAHIEPFDAGRYKGKGGLANIYNLVTEIRKQKQNVLLLDAGDMFQGTPYFNFYKGEVMLKLMSEIGYDAGTLGNHEFDNGLEGIANVVNHAQFPIVSANYDFTNTILDKKFEPYTIINKGKLKIGIYGLGVEFKGLVSPKNYGKAICYDAIGIARQTEEELKRKGCDLIIALSHLGYKYNTDQVSDLVLAKETSYTNLIIGGHTHTFLDTPTKVNNQKGEQVLVAQAGWGGMRLGQIDLTIRK